MSRWGVVYLDVYRLTLMRPDLSFDGQHYVNGDKPGEEDVYMNIRAAVLHALGCA
jgi:hypothetical protein